MENSIKIKVSIADRVYPLTIESNQEEAIITASRKIDTMINQFEESYAVRDKQDVLAMCALQFASKSEQNQTSHEDEAIERITKMNIFLEKYLKNK